jgi:hypothetical protein
VVAQPVYYKIVEELVGNSVLDVTQHSYLIQLCPCR